MIDQTNFADDVIDSWRAGKEPNAQAALAELPPGSDCKSIAMKLAYEEYCLRREAGETIAPSTFCNRFPGWRHSLARLLEMHDYLEQTASVSADSDTIVWPAAGEMFLGFDLEREIGRGAFARVFLAREPALGQRQVVLKISQTGLGEAEILGRLEHPHIVPVFSVREDARTGLTAICMPYLGTATLTDVLDAAIFSDKPPRDAEVIFAAARRADDARLTDALPTVRDESAAEMSGKSYVEAVSEIGVSLAEALELAHRRGVLHLDMKPSNVLLTPAAQPMLLDFNLSRRTDGGGVRLGGTLAYMAPEQLRAVFELGADAGALPTATPLDARADVYALGVVLFELLTGQRPFALPVENGTTLAGAMALIEKQQHGAPLASALNAQVDANLARIVNRCLQFDASQRYATAGKLAAELRACLTRKAGLLGTLKRHRRLAALCTAAAVLVAVGISWWWAQRAPEAWRAYERGLEYLSAGNAPAAVGQFNVAAAEMPNEEALLWARGLAHQRIGQHDYAIGDFTELLKIKPTGQAQAALAYSYAVRGAYPLAVEHYEKALAAGYETASLFNNLAYCYSRDGNKLEQAIHFATLALEKKPDFGRAYFTRALAATNRSHVKKNEDYSQAVSDIQKARHCLPPDWKVDFLAALMYLHGAKTQPELRLLALDLLESAVENGGQPAMMHQSLKGYFVADHPRWQALLNGPKPAEKPPLDVLASHGEEFSLR